MEKSYALNATLGLSQAFYPSNTLFQVQGIIPNTHVYWVEQNSGGTPQVSSNYILRSYDGETWENGSDATLTGQHPCVYFKVSATGQEAWDMTGNSTNWGLISDQPYKVSGRIRDFTINTSSNQKRIYINMFGGEWKEAAGHADKLTEAKYLILDSTEGCTFTGMFWGCVNLLETPILNTTTMVENLYYQMFNGCTSLRTIAALPTTVAKNCYLNMLMRAI